MKNVKNVVKGLLLGCVIVVGCLLVNTQGANAVESPVHSDSNGKYIECTNGNKIYEKDINDYQLKIVKQDGNKNIVNINSDLYGFYAENKDDYKVGDLVHITFKNGEITNAYKVNKDYNGTITNLYDFGNGYVDLKINVNGKEYETIDNYTGFKVGNNVNVTINPYDMVENVVIDNTNNYNVEIQSIDKTKNTITVNKDGQLYSFYVDNTDSYYLAEMVNITMDKDNNNIIDCNVIDKVIVSSGVIKSVSDEYLTVSVNGCDYKIENDIGANWSVNDKVNTVIQDGKLINISPVK